jgi:UDPglucose 6-dehydrogenase
MRVTVFGAGYVGLVTGACLARSGHEVVIADTDRDKLAALAEGRAPFHEPGLDDVITAGLAAGRLSFAHGSELASYGDVTVIAVGTPATASGAADMRFVRSVVDQITRDAPRGTVVVMKSTVPPGTGVGLSAEFAASGIAYVSNPEFLREGSAVNDWFHTDRIVLGGDAGSVATARRLYADIESPVIACDVTSAEMIKYASNAFLATKVSFINEIAALCDRVGGDIDVVADGLGADARIGRSFLSAGIGYGGSCFPKDTRALDFLSTMNSYDFHLLKAVIEVNARQRLLPVIALRSRLGTLSGKRVAVLGLTFKPNTDDTRESPSREIVELLLTEGARVTVYDPVGALPDLAHCVAVAGSVADAVAGTDAVIIATEWPQIVEADWGVLAATMAEGGAVFDGRNSIDPGAVTATGRSYTGIGRSGPAL